MDTGIRTGITYLANDGSDGVDAYRTSIRNVAAWAETQGAMYAQGILSARPAAGKAGRLYRATDDTSGVIYYDDGTAWQSVGVSAPTDGSAATPSLRTLGAGSTQAAAGNHTHAIGAITGAGDSAPKNVGTTAGTVAAGDHTHASSGLYVYKTADTSRTGTATITADPHLTLTLGVGTWRVEAELAVTGSSGGDFAVSMPFSGTATTRFGTAMRGPGTSASALGDTGGNYLISGSSSFGTTSSDGYVCAVQVLVVTASGAVTVNWAQAVASGTTTLRSGSHLIATKLE